MPHQIHNFLPNCLEYQPSMLVYVQFYRSHVESGNSNISQEANLVEEVEDSPDFWSGPVQSYNCPVEHRFLIGLDWSTNGPLVV